MQGTGLSTEEPETASPDTFEPQQECVKTSQFTRPRADGSTRRKSAVPIPNTLEHTQRAQTQALFHEIERPSTPKRAKSEPAPPKLSWGAPRLSLLRPGRLAKVIRANWWILTTPKKPLPEKAPSTKDSLMAVVKASWLNVLLIFIPVGWALHFANVSPVIVFVCTFLSIIPLAKLLAFATEELAIRVGQTLGGLLNATLGNAVELIVAIIALVQCQLTIVQSSLVGSILSNLLLVLGMCFFAGGTQFSEQGFLVTPTQLNSSLLVLSVIAILLPGAFIMAITDSNNSDNDPYNNVTGSVQGSDILQMSHGVALILLTIYACNLAFTLWSHKEVMNESAFKSTPYGDTVNNPIQSIHHHMHEAKVHMQERTHDRKARKTHSSGSVEDTDSPVVEESAEHASEARHLENGRAGSPSKPLKEEGEGKTAANVTTPKARGSKDDLEKGADGKEEEVEKVEMNVLVTVLLLAAVTVLVGVTAEFLVSSIDGVTATGHISQQFVGLILLPIVGNAAEHVTAVTVSIKDKLDLSIGVAVGSSIQIALFVIPFIVVLSWIMGKPLTMLFDPFQSVVLFLAVITVNYCVQDGKSNWLEGMILMMLYAIIAVCFWFYPGYNPTTVLGLTC